MGEFEEDTFGVDGRVEEGVGGSDETGVVGRVDAFDDDLDRTPPRNVLEEGRARCSLLLTLVLNDLPFMVSSVVETRMVGKKKVMLPESNCINPILEVVEI